MLIVLSF